MEKEFDENTLNKLLKGYEDYAAFSDSKLEQVEFLKEILEKNKKEKQLLEIKKIVLDSMNKRIKLLEKEVNVFTSNDFVNDILEDPIIESIWNSITSKDAEKMESLNKLKKVKSNFEQQFLEVQNKANFTDIWNEKVLKNLPPPPPPAFQQPPVSPVIVKIDRNFNREAESNGTLFMNTYTIDYKYGLDNGELVNLFNTIMKEKKKDDPNNKRERYFWDHVYLESLRDVKITITTEKIFIWDEEKPKTPCAFCNQKFKPYEKLTFLNTFFLTEAIPKELSKDLLTTCYTHYYHLHCAAFMIQAQNKPEKPLCIGLCSGEKCEFKMHPSTKVKLLSLK